MERPTGFSWPLILRYVTPMRIHRRRAAATIAAHHAGLPEIPTFMDDLGFDPIGSTPDECAANIRGEIAKWARVIKEAKIRTEQ